MTDSPDYETVAIVIRGPEVNPSRVQILNLDAWDDVGKWTRPGFFHDFLVFNRINDGIYDPPTNFHFLAHDVVPIRIINRLVVLLII